MTSEKEKALLAWAKEHAGRQDMKRTLVGLYKQGPLETNQQFAERVAKEMQEHLAKSRRRTNTSKPDKES